MSPDIVELLRDADAPLYHAAADEIERLRGLAEKDGQTIERWNRSAQEARAEIGRLRDANAEAVVDHVLHEEVERLRGMIVRAPHARHCEAGSPMWPGRCTCWKRDADPSLEAPSQPTHPQKKHSPREAG